MRCLVFIVVMVTSLLVTPCARAANSWGTDISDLWWNPGESGWGVNLAHQQEVVFLTMFVYGPDNRARWYVASNMVSNGAPNWYLFSGDLYETQGPYLAGGFNPNNVFVRRVGSATLNVDTTNTATLSYSVDGLSVQKRIERQTFKSANLTGNYVVAIRTVRSGCASGNGVRYITSDMAISHNSVTGAMTTFSSNSSSSCTDTGQYYQSGRMGRFLATTTCAVVAGGTSVASADYYEIEARYDGFIMRFTVSPGGSCKDEGTITGVKK